MKPKHLDAFMDTAYRFAELSEAVRARVGAIIVKDRRIISIGYNGMPSGWDNTCEDIEWMDSGAGGWLNPDEIEERWPFEGIYMDKDGEEYVTRYRLVTKPQVLHAEANAIAKLAQSPESAKDAVLFCTHMPCIECAKLIHQSGIRTVYYGEQYVAAKGSGEEFLSNSGISLTWLPPKPKPIKTVEKFVEVERIVELDKPLLFNSGKLLPPARIYEISSRRNEQGLLLSVSVFRKIAFLNITARYNWDNLVNDVRAVDNLFEITDWVVDYSYEAHTMQAEDYRKGTIFDAIHQTADKLNMKLNSWHLVHGNFYINEAYKSWKSKNNIKETLASVNAMPTLFFHRYFKNAVKHYSQLDFRSLLKKNADRYYCTFNGRAGYDRVQLLKYLHSNNLLEKGYSTWHFDNETWQILYSEQLGLDRINRLPAGETATEDFTTISVEWSKRPEHELIECYRQSLFEIVVETITNIDQESYNWASPTEGRLAPAYILNSVPNANTVFLTEKTARPLLWGMPFFLNSGQHALKSLREMGFKTFDVLWDETYDTLPDAHARATAMHESIRAVLTAPLSELQEKIAINQDIFKHNQTRFIELASMRPQLLWIEMYNAIHDGHGQRNIMSQLRQPNAHIKIEH